MKTPEEIANELYYNGHLTEDQANTIAAEIYQPILEELEKLSERIYKFEVYGC